MVRRFSHRLQREAGCRVRSKRTRDGFSCLWGDGAALKLAGRARRFGLDMVGLGPIEERRTGGMIFSFGAQAWCDVFSCRFQLEASRYVCSKRTHAGTRCLLGGGAVLKRTALVPHCARYGLRKPFE